MGNFMSSPKTTVTAILGIIALVSNVLLALFDADPATNPDWGAVVPALLALVGTLFARDNNTTSEQAGAK